MVEIAVGIEGMACGMCEAHINEAVRNAFEVKKVSSSHTKKRTVIIAERASSLMAPSSFTLMRRRVMQLVAVITLDLPPTPFRML